MNLHDAVELARRCSYRAATDETAASLYGSDNYAVRVVLRTPARFLLLSLHSQVGRKRVKVHSGTAKFWVEETVGKLATRVGLFHFAMWPHCSLEWSSPWLGKLSAGTANDWVPRGHLRGLRWLLRCLSGGLH